MKPSRLKRLRRRVGALDGRTGPVVWADDDPLFTLALAMADGVVLGWVRAGDPNAPPPLRAGPWLRAGRPEGDPIARLNCRVRERADG